MLYLLHSTVPLGGTGQFSAQHYLGWCHEQNLAVRIAEHRTGHNGAAITKAYRAAGGKLLLVAIAPGGTREDERRLKRHHHLKKFCPICTPTIKVGEKAVAQVALIPLKRQSAALWRKLTTGSGGDLRHRNTIRRPIIDDGSSPHEPLQATGTGSGAEWVRVGHGGKLSIVRVEPSSPGATGSAGTKLPSTSGSSEWHSDE